jgi:hypothetical protein
LDPSLHCLWNLRLVDLLFHGNRRARQNGLA